MIERRSSTSRDEIRAQAANRFILPCVCNSIYPEILVAIFFMSSSSAVQQVLAIACMYTPAL